MTRIVACQPTEDTRRPTSGTAPALTLLRERQDHPGAPLLGERPPGTGRTFDLDGLVHEINVYQGVKP